MVTNEFGRTPRSRYARAKRFVRASSSALEMVTSPIVMAGRPGSAWASRPKRTPSGVTSPGITGGFARPTTLTPRRVEASTVVPFGRGAVLGLASPARDLGGAAFSPAPYARSDDKTPHVIAAATNVRFIRHTPLRWRH